MRVATMVNDLHSELNATEVSELIQVTSAQEVANVISSAKRSGQKVSISAGRHAMGAQQFATDSMLMDMSNLNQVLDFDSICGRIKVAGGIQWPELIDFLSATKSGWSIAQKQTGCDKLSIGGAISANIHGRGLAMRPFISDVEDFQMVTANGDLVNCSRTENSELFRLAAGGYGLFGPIVSATIKLARRTALRRNVEVVDCTDLISKFNNRIDDGHMYGDFQFSIDHNSDDFLRKGLLSTYKPVSGDDHVISSDVSLSRDQWKELLYLAHVDKSRAFDVYAGHYLRTNGQTYWSDRFQLATYLDGYHHELDERTGCPKATEIISEIYVPREHLSAFLLRAADFLRTNKADVIYGTVRLIEKDQESFLAWAREAFACTIFNIHTEHSPEGIERSARAFRGLIDLAISFGGSYYLTYHKFASRTQLDTCYPQFAEFLSHKVNYDPAEIFSSNWYQHYKSN